MSVSIWNTTITQQATFTKANSGYTNTNAGPTANSFATGVTSGRGYLHQVPVASGSTFTLDLVSGGNTDLVGDSVNISQLYSFQVLPFSGAIQAETTQSGGIVLPQFGLSGGGFLVNPGATLAVGESASGVYTPLSAAHGNFVFRAVSGACLLSVGYEGLQ